MKKIARTFAAALLTAGSFVPATYMVSTEASARSETQRFHECRQLRNSGQLKWYGIASGTVHDGGGRNGYNGFHTKSCHASRQSCERWVRNIYHEIRYLDDLRTAYCKQAY